MLKNQKFGVEIELTGISRSSATKVLTEVFGTTFSIYDDTATDQKGRTWQVVYDSSINGTGAEVVSPILTYDDIELIQEVLRALRQKGARADSSCGIHVHVDGANHTPISIKNIMNFMCNRQNLIFEALDVKSNRERYCKKVCPALVKKIKKIRDINRSSIADLWYSRVNHNHTGGSSGRYNQTRYQCLNLHSYFSRGTVEFRMFNGTTHAGELKSYIQFALAVSAWAIESSDRIVFKNIDAYNATQKANIMLAVLTERLGLTGKEFKTARLHLTKHLDAKAQVAA